MALEFFDENELAKEGQFKLPFGRLQHEGFIHPKARRSLISEEFRLIKRRLFQKMSLADLHHKEAVESDSEENNLQHVILITSSKPAEGKSFTALNLAISIVLDEKYNVLLIDADVARATITKRLGLEKTAGLTDTLRQSDPDLSSVIKRDIHHPFSVIPAGSGVVTATDLFGGKKMHRFVSDIASRYKDRIIIFDAPPLLASTEAVVLAQQVGQIIYVIDGSSTPRSTIEAGLDVLGHYENVNLILNKTTMHSEHVQFGAYYDYYFNQEK